MSDIKQVISDSFKQYAGAVLQSRALVDVRDCFKPSARQVFYCMETDNFIHSKPFKKTLKAIGSCMRVYIHGDSSCEGIIMRAGQPFAMRYPIVEVEGSYGNLTETGNWAAPRYTSARLSKTADYLFNSLKKNTIDEWRDNYDDTEKYPSVLPSKGFYNIVNGTFGLGVGAASSIPQFNIKEVNNALIKLLWNENISFEEIYCAPDFATGAILLNESEIKESLKNGQGSACKIRATINYDSKERCLIVTEIPYGVYTNTICGQLEKILDSEENPGIERFNDLTGATPLIKIYLTKNANVDIIIKYLYKNTSLQSHYGVNLTMLKDGRFPQVFTWKEALSEHLKHEKNVYRKAFEYDLNKIKNRLHIIDGLLKAISMINEVIKTIRQARDTKEASIALQKLLDIDELQAKAILDIKLARLAHLEVDKLVKERDDLNVEKERIENILSNESLLKKEIENGLREVAEKFGDARRTKILNIEKEDEEPIEIKNLMVSITNKNNFYTIETSNLYTQKRGNVGNKVKLEKDEYFINSITIETDETLLIFTKSGMVYHYPVSKIKTEQLININEMGDIKEPVCAILGLRKNNSKNYLIFLTKNGLIKKTDISEYNLSRKTGVKAITLADNDEIINVLNIENECVSLLTENGYFLTIKTEDISPVGRISKGIKAIKLNEDYVKSAKIFEEDSLFVASITEKGLIKKIPKRDFCIGNRATKGTKIQKIEDDLMADFCFVSSEGQKLLIVSSNSCLKISGSEVSEFSKGARGIIGLKLTKNAKVISLRAEE